MKITSGTFNLKVDLKDKEERVLAEILEIVTNAMKAESSPLTTNRVELAEKIVEAMVSHEIEPEAEVCCKESETEKNAVEVTITVPSFAQKEEADNEDVPRRFMIGKCPCGEMHFLFIYDNGKTFEFKCRHCGKDHAVNYHELEHAQTECICGQISTFFTAPGTLLKKTDCKKCGHPNTIQRPKKVLTYK